MHCKIIWSKRCKCWKTWCYKMINNSVYRCITEPKTEEYKVELIDEQT